MRGDLRSPTRVIEGARLAGRGAGRLRGSAAGRRRPRPSRIESVFSEEVAVLLLRTYSDRARPSGWDARVILRVCARGCCVLDSVRRERLDRVHRLRVVWRADWFVRQLGNWIVQFKWCRRGAEHILRRARLLRAPDDDRDMGHPVHGGALDRGHVLLHQRAVAGELADHGGRRLRRHGRVPGGLRDDRHHGRRLVHAVPERELLAGGRHGVRCVQRRGCELLPCRVGRRQPRHQLHRGVLLCRRRSRGRFARARVCVRLCCSVARCLTPSRARGVQSRALQAGTASLASPHQRAPAPARAPRGGTARLRAPPRLACRAV